VILVAIVAAGFLFMGLTAAPNTEAAPAEVEPKPNEAIEVIQAKVRVTLSGAAKTVDLFANAGHYRFSSTGEGTYSDELKIAKENPVLEIRVDWLEETTTHRFAKVVIEAPGKKTFTHFFEADGDIDDFIELPF